MYYTFLLRLNVILFKKKVTEMKKKMFSNLLFIEQNDNLLTFIFSVPCLAILFSRVPYSRARSNKTHKMTECKKSVQCPLFQAFEPHSVTRLVCTVYLSKQSAAPMLLRCERGTCTALT